MFPSGTVFTLSWFCFFVGPLLPLTPYEDKSLSLFFKRDLKKKIAYLFILAPLDLCCRAQASRGDGSLADTGSSRTAFSHCSLQAQEL